MVPLDPTQCISSVVGGDGEFWWSKQRFNVILLVIKVGHEGDVEEKL